MVHSTLGLAADFLQQVGKSGTFLGELAPKLLIYHALLAA
jgi:arginine/ornithine N-succinyltransferase beta subunit